MRRLHGQRVAVGRIRDGGHRTAEGSADLANPGRRTILALGWWVGIGANACAVFGAAGRRAHAAAKRAGLSPFSNLPVGALADASGWRHEPLRDLPPNKAEIVESGASRVLRISSKSSASAWGHQVVDEYRAAERLAWRWAVSGQPNRSALGEKGADDFAARLYVIFDYPLDKVPWASRVGIRLARALYGADVPAAAICYVWHPSSPSEHLQDSPYTSRVRMLVPSATGDESTWRYVERDIRADFARAFGAEFGDGMAPIKAVLVSSDTDQTGGEVHAYFGDIVLTQAN